MNKKRGFSIIELVVILAICCICAAIIIPPGIAAIKQQKTNNRTSSIYPFHVGDVVVMTSLSVTGQVNSVCPRYVNVIFKSVDGTVSKINDVNVSLLKKASQ